MLDVRVMPYDLDVTWDDEGDEPSAYPDPASARYPSIEQAALTTQRTAATALVVAVGFDAESLDVCRQALDESAEIVVVSEPAATREMVAVLRPRLVLVMAAAEDPPDEPLASAIARYGARLVRCSSGASAAVVSCLVRQAAAVVFSGEADSTDRATQPPPALRAVLEAAPPFLGEAWPARTGT